MLRCASLWTIFLCFLTHSLCSFVQQRHRHENKFSCLSLFRAKNVNSFMIEKKSPNKCLGFSVNECRSNTDFLALQQYMHNLFLTLRIAAVR